MSTLGHCSRRGKQGDKVYNLKVDLSGQRIAEKKEIEPSPCGSYNIDSGSYVKDSSEQPCGMRYYFQLGDQDLDTQSKWGALGFELTKSSLVFISITQLHSFLHQNHSYSVEHK
jgi:hypothetical protein